MGKVATHTNAPRIKELNNVNAAAIGRRKKLLPGEVFRVIPGEVSRGHSSCSNEP